MPSILTQIGQWATTLPYWEQAALDRILAGVQLADAHYDELLRFLLEDEGLAPKTGHRPQLMFSNSQASGSQSTKARLRLVRVSNLKNVNALVEGQALTFGPALTAVFGANGSGKSGYARVLACAGFSRGDKEVLPDVTRPPSASTTLSADVEVSDGLPDQVLHYQIGSRCPELESFYVFDSTSVREHLTGENAFSFSPAGLSYLTQLAAVADQVRQRLEARIQQSNQPHGFGMRFQGESEVTKLIASLGPETSLEQIQQVATLTPDEEKQISQLDTEIARLKLLDIPRKIDELEQQIQDLQQLASRLGEAESRLDDEAIGKIRQAARDYDEKQSEARRLSIDQFKSDHFGQTGSEVWHTFVSAAKVLADAEQASNGPYPQPGDHCLLCQQPLSPAAQSLLRSLWEFLESQAQAKLDEAQSAVNLKRAELNAVDLGFFDNQTVSYRYLLERDVPLLAQVNSFVACCAQRRDAALSILDTQQEQPTPQMEDSGLSAMGEIVEALKTRCRELEEEVPAQQILEREQKLLNLRHRKAIGQYLPEIEEYIRRRAWARKAAKITVNTRHITVKYNELFKQLMTDRYIQLFEETLKVLQRPLMVRIRTAGRKAETYKQIALECDPSASPAQAKPEKVLSEGEKRAVALADFLTEVALDTTSSGIILDDPVTSLDLEWRETIAAILAKEAKGRQVIVFTHDLPFLYFLKKHAEGLQINIATHWIKRGDNDGKPGYVFLNNSPALERDYRKASQAQEFFQRAKGAPAAEQEGLLRQGFGALRTAYEALIIFDLFQEVVMRFDERISFGRLKDVVWDPSIALAVNGRCEQLSKYIEGHLHSDALGATKPTCKMLMDEIEAFHSIKAKLKGLKSKSS
ncbi:MAG: AAA family ATPase [Chloroflexota bacterium]|nr:AAA family ATPase [Chloroflexota bacterium]